MGLNYRLQNKAKLSFNTGFFHGSSGTQRAKNIILFTKETMDKVSILALASTLFDSSSKLLKGMVTDKLMSGDLRDDKKDGYSSTLKSSAFNVSIILKCFTDGAFTRGVWVRDPSRPIENDAGHGQRSPGPALCHSKVETSLLLKEIFTNYPEKELEQLEKATFTLIAKRFKNTLDKKKITSLPTTLESGESKEMTPLV